jgi:hypothetical protein
MTLGGIANGCGIERLMVAADRMKRENKEKNGNSLFKTSLKDLMVQGVHIALSE